MLLVLDKQHPVHLDHMYTIVASQANKDGDGGRFDDSEAVAPLHHVPEEGDENDTDARDRC